MIKFIKRKINNYKRHYSAESIRLRKLYNYPRYTKGQYSLNGSIVNFPDSTSFVFIYRELFQLDIYKFHTNNPRPFIIDCGANIGLSVIYFKTKYPQSKVLAFEPERNIFSYLKKNIESFKFDDVELRNQAVWKNEELVIFNNEGADASRIASLDDKQQFDSSYEVQAVRLSDFINSNVDLLKIDIEGAELEVIKEIENKLHFVERIFIEYHSFEAVPQCLDEILKILTANGFHYYIDAPNRMRQMPFIDKTTFLSFDFFLNIYAIRNSNSE